MYVPNCDTFFIAFWF